MGGVHMPKKNIAIIIGLVVIVGAGIGTYFYVTNTPKNKYLLSEKQSYDAINEYIGERFKPELDLQKDLADDKYNMNFTVQAEVPGKLAEVFGLPDSLVNSSKLEMSAAHDPDNKTSEISINPTIANNEIGKMAWSADGKNQYLQAPLLKNPLKMKNKEIIKGLEKLTGENIDDIEGLTNDTLNLNTLMSSPVTQDDIDEITGRYLRFVLEEIDEDNFTKGSGKVKVLGEKKELDSIQLDVTPKEVKQITLATLKEIKSDKDIEKIVEKSDQSIDYKKEVENMIKEVKDTEDKNFPTIKSIIYVDGKDIQKRLMTIDFDGDVFKLALDTNIHEDIEMKLVAGSKGQADFVKIEGSSKGKDTVTDEYKLTVDGDFTTTLLNEETWKDKTRTDAAILKINEGTEEFVINMNQKLTTDGKNNKQTSKSVVAFDVSGDTVEIHADSNVVLKEDVAIKVEGAEDVNELSAEELQQIRDDASNELMNIYLTIIGATE